ncbi:MAG TPA: hypothetical protein VMC10_19595, partial [Stellaceae bacterium]|nr:hypothetical protein [Stellaceae bacterium]
GAWLLLRESAAMAAPVPARPGVLWDGRFRLGTGPALPDDATLGALGDDAGALRAASPLPAAVLRTLPALRVHGNLFAVPHLRYSVVERTSLAPIAFEPVVPTAGAPFEPVRGGMVQQLVEPAAATADWGCETPPDILC